jgi:hypothetical protein
MAAGEQLQPIQDAEQLKTTLAGEPVVLTPQIVSVTITSSADKMFPSGDWQLPTNAAPLDKMVPTGATLSKLWCQRSQSSTLRRSLCAVIRTTCR